MKQAIVILTVENSPFYNVCINSLKEYKDYEKYVVIMGCTRVHYIDGFNVTCENGDYFETGAMRHMMNTDVDEFFLLQDSVVVKDTEIFDIAFKEHKGKSVSVAGQYCSFLGKYRRDILKNLEIPFVETKQASVDAEHFFNTTYTKADNPIVLDEFFGWEEYDSRFEEKFGRLNKVFENKWLIKYKGTWSPDMIK